MSHLSDKELDRLSREAAEQFDVEGSPSGWDALEKELDKAIPVDGPKPGRRRRGFGYWGGGAALLVLVIAGLFYFSGPSNNSANPGSTAGSTPQTLTETNAEKASPSLQEAENITGSNNKPVSPNEPVNGIAQGNKSKDQLGQQDASDGNPEVIGSALLGEKAVEQNSASNISSKSKPGFSSGSNRSSSKDKRYTLSTKPKQQNSSSKDDRYDAPGNGSNELTGSIDQQGIASVKEDQENDLYQPILPSIDHGSHVFFIADSTHIDSLMQDLAARSPERDTSVTSTTVFPWEIGMLLGADKSNVNFNGGFKTGFNYGIYLGYRINKRWSVNTGLVFDKKFYTAKGKDFHPPKGYWTDYVKLDAVSGNCTMWEIPLNIRYDLSITRKGYWFASTGLSTYLMQNEDYDYYYWQNGNYYTKHRAYPSDEKAILGILNLSAGFEKNFTPHLSLQIEPYMRVPLKGVGFGKMQMNSFGTNVILKFKGGKARNY